MVKIITFLGSGSAFNPLLGNTSAYFVRNNKFFLIDAGETVFTKLYEMKLLEQYNDIYIIITHTHADHVGSLSSIISYSYFVLGKKVKIIHLEKSLIKLLEMMGITSDAYEMLTDEINLIGDVRIEAVSVKHADDIRCYGYVLDFSDERIYYSGDSYEIPSMIVKDFFAGKIQTIYQDTTEFSSDHLSHCPLSTLENVFPIEKRKDIYCMHFSNDFLKKIEEKGFKYVQVKNISAN